MPHFWFMQISRVRFHRHKGSCRWPFCTNPAKTHHQTTNKFLFSEQLFLHISCNTIKRGKYFSSKQCFAYIIYSPAKTCTCLSLNVNAGTFSDHRQCQVRESNDLSFLWQTETKAYNSARCREQRWWQTQYAHSHKSLQSMVLHAKTVQSTPKHKDRLGELLPFVTGSVAKHNSHNI